MPFREDDPNGLKELGSNLAKGARDKVKDLGLLAGATAAFGPLGAAAVIFGKPLVDLYRISQECKKEKK